MWSGPNEHEVRRWLEEARPGQTIEYFRGDLAVSKAENALLPEPHRWELSRVADLLWHAAAHRRVHLVQHRRGPGEWSYIAVARERPPSTTDRSVTHRTQLSNSRRRRPWD